MGIESMVSMTHFSMHTDTEIKEVNDSDTSMQDDVTDATCRRTIYTLYL